MEDNKDLGGAAVRGEAVADARAALEKKWDAEGACESCGWHALLSEHYVDDEDISEALLFGGKLKLSCLSKDDDTRDSHRGVTIEISARAADAPSEPSETLYQFRARVPPGRGLPEGSGWESCCKGAHDELALNADYQVRSFGLLKSRAADALDSQPTTPTIDYVRSEWESMCRKAVGVLNKHIVPGGISDHEALNELYGIFDSEEYRATGAIEQDACEARQAVQMGIDRSFASSQPTDGGVRND